MDIKDAFLMAWQPEDEASGIIYKDKKYRLIRCLPGQRAAARQWFLLFPGVPKLTVELRMLCNLPSSA